MLAVRNSFQRATLSRRHAWKEPPNTTAYCAIGLSYFGSTDSPPVFPQTPSEGANVCWCRLYLHFAGEARLRRVQPDELMQMSFVGAVNAWYGDCQTD